MIRIFHHYVSKIAFMLLLLEVMILLTAAVASAPLWLKGRPGGAEQLYLPALAFALVVVFSMGTLGMYWNDAARTAERFRPLPDRLGGLPIQELAVWSGDTVRADEDGFLYFIGRSDDMIKTSGYRVSPAEVEEVIYATGLVTEAAAIGIPNQQLGQSIALIAAVASGAAGDEATLLAACKRALPSYMVPARIDIRTSPLPRNPNGKIDRKLLADELAAQQAER